MSAGLIIAGTGLSIFGQIQANIAQAQAERENAAWLEEQAAFIQESTERSLSVYKRQAGQFKEQQAAAIGASGFELSGSAGDIFDDTLRSISEEIDAIEEQGFMQEREALLKASSARRQSKRLSSFGLNLLQAAGPALTGAGRVL